MLDPFPKRKQEQDPENIEVMEDEGDNSNKEPSDGNGFIEVYEKVGLVAKVW